MCWRLGSAPDGAHFAELKPSDSSKGKRGGSAVKRVGVFICHCGINIATNVDVARAARELSEHPGVVRAEHYTYMCSDPGQNLIKKSIKDDELDGVVVAACSPNLHLTTFRRASQSAGLNPYLCEEANIREQCSWVHDDREKATAKAVRLIQAMVEKVIRNRPLVPVKVPVTRKALIVGGGIAGMQAALDIANSGYETIVVEKGPSIGGHMAQLSETFPTLDCSQCIMTPKMVEVAQNPLIKLHTYSELEDISGYVGNFNVKIKEKARSVDMEKCTGCGDCWNNCPVRNEPAIPEVPSIAPMIEEEMLAKLDGILQRYKGQIGVEIPILQEINLEYNYLPQETLRYVAERLQIPVSRLYEIATFFNAFSLEPRGRYTVSVCLGTACHVRGGGRILERVERDLGIKAGETTEDLNFSLETVRCLGCCGLAPVVTIGSDLYGKIAQAELPKILRKYRNGRG